MGAGLLAHAEDRFLESEPYGEDPAVRRQLTAQHERWARAASSARCIGIFEDGEVAGWCRLYERDGIVEIDSVGVLPEQRGRGLGRALLEGVLAQVPEDHLLFLLADTEDWPKDLYGSVGFDVVGERLGVTRA
jgi:ribosomal protein S18 acetylase RimI-like enzyme